MQFMLSIKKLTKKITRFILQKIAMKRDSKYSGNHREKLAGEKLYGRNVEPVLELYTEYVACAICEAILGAPITASEYRP